MKRNVLAAVWAAMAILCGEARAQAYPDDAQCFGATVPAFPSGTTGSATVNGRGGTYSVTAWRLPCQSDPNVYVLLLQFRAISGSPSVSDPTVWQTGVGYEPYLLVKNPAASLLIDYAYVGGAIATLNVIYKQSRGARFDASGRLRIAFPDTSTSLGSTDITLPALTATPEMFFGNLTDMWWNESENGTGLSIIQHGGSNQLFAVWYTYSDVGEPLWLVIPGGTWTADGRSFTGMAYRTRGTTYSRPWDPATFSVGNALGSVQFTFSAADAMTLTYTFGPSRGTKTFTRQRF